MSRFITVNGVVYMIPNQKTAACQIYKAAGAEKKN